MGQITIPFLLDKPKTFTNISACFHQEEKLSEVVEKGLGSDLRWQTVNTGRNITSHEGHFRHATGCYNAEVDYLSGSQMMKQT